jgi:tetratricopeptide (TPR) repeat protein
LAKRDYAKAVADLTKMLEMQPKYYSARFNRALCYEQLREYDKAIDDYSKIIDDDTDFSRNGNTKANCLAATRHYRGRAYQWYKKDYAKAVADYTESLRLDPQLEEMVNYRRGESYQSLKEYAKARDDFDVALTKDPAYPNLLNAYAWQLATCPEAKHRDGKKAMEYARAANEKSGYKRPECVDTLAAAHAEAGLFEEAIKLQKNAIGLLGPKADEQRKAMQARLKLYEAGKPFRSE